MRPSIQHAQHRDGNGKITRRMAMGALALAVLCSATHVQGQMADPRLAVTNHEVYATALAGNTLYIGGNFTGVNDAPTGSAVAVDSIGGMPRSGWPMVDGYVSAVAPDESGGCYVGGFFEHVAGVPRHSLAHIRSDGTLDGWNPDPGPTGTVYALARSGGAIYVGGDFTSVGGQARRNIAALDATTGQATPWDPDADSAVRALAVDGGTVYAGGHFGAIGGQARAHVAALDAATGQATTWDPGSDEDVSTLAVGGGTVYASGAFTHIGGEARNYLAALDAVSGRATAWNPGANGSVLALAVSGGTIHVGGDFTSIGGQARRNLAALDAATGQATAWNPGASQPVYVLAVSGGTVYVGGTFTSVGGQSRERIAALDATTGQATSWNPGAGDLVEAIGVSGGTVYFGGMFSALGSRGGQTRNRVAALDVATGQATAWNPNANHAVYTLAASGDVVYAGGLFASIGGRSRAQIAALDATTGQATDWNPQANGAVNAVVVSGDLVYVGGDFTHIGGQAREHIAALVAATGQATDWDPGADASVRTLLVSGGLVYAGGDFTSIGGQDRNHLAALDAATGQATAWDPDVDPSSPDATVYAVALRADTVYVGGSFASIGGESRRNAAALDAVTGRALAWDPDADAEVHALVSSGGRILAGGGFQNIGGQARGGVAELDEATGRPTDWNPDGEGYAYALALDGDAVYAGGSFGFGGLCLSSLRRFIPAPPAPPSVRVLSPDGGETLTIGRTSSLTWSATADAPGVQSVDLYLSRTGPSGPWELLAAGVPGADPYPWTVTGPETAAECHLRVDARDFAGRLATDVSDAGFRIAGSPTPTLVELFRALETATGVRIEWELSVTARSVVVQRGASDTGPWVAVRGTVTRDGGTNVVLDGDATPGGPSWYRLDVTLADGSAVQAGPIPVTPAGAVNSFALAMPTPTPTRGAALLSFAVPRRSNVRLSLVDVQGRVVARLADGLRPPGRYTAALQLGDVEPGLYFVRLRAPGADLVRRVVIVR